MISQLRDSIQKKQIANRTETLSVLSKDEEREMKQKILAENCRKELSTLKAKIEHILDDITTKAPASPEEMEALARGLEQTIENNHSPMLSSEENAAIRGRLNDLQFNNIHREPGFKSYNRVSVDCDEQTLVNKGQDRAGFGRLHIGDNEEAYYQWIADGHFTYGEPIAETIKQNIVVKRVKK